MVKGEKWPDVRARGAAGERRLQEERAEYQKEKEITDHRH